MLSAIVTFTARPLRWILADQGSRDWRLNAGRARQCKFLVCTQNRHNAEFGAPTAPHGSAFLIGRISDVVVSPERHDRWLIKISEYLECNLPNIWGRSGHLRYPVWYTTLEELGIDLSALGPFHPLPLAGGASSPPMPSQQAGEDSWKRLEAILAQIDRIPERTSPLDPLEWDERGLPR
jgi:hypothetical protein